MTTALIDGDIIVYNAGFAVEKKIYTLTVDGEEIIPDEKFTKTSIKEYIKSRGITREHVFASCRTEVEPESHARQIAKITIQRILEETEAKDYKIYLTSTDKSNYRFGIAKTKEYKGNRTAGRPYHYDAIRDYIKDVWKAEEVFGCEADDAMGIAQCTSVGTIICSIDKDMLMIPGKHYNFHKKVFTDIDERQGYYNFYSQMLTGDSADNIPGIYGIGPAAVKKLFVNCQTREDFEKRTKQCYSKAFPEMTKKQLRERFTEIGQLLWIRRQPDEMWSIL